MNNGMSTAGTTYVHAFRPSEYTTALLRAIETDCPALGDGPVLDMGVGSGLLLAALIHAGATQAWGVDIDPAAIEASQSLLASATHGRTCRLILGDMWDAVPNAAHFDVIVANLPHFPANVSYADRPKNWTGGDGRNTIDRFLQGLPKHLSATGTAYFTHHDLIGLDHTVKLIESLGLRCSTVTEWTVFEPPERMEAVSLQTRARAEKSTHYYGGYAFVTARIIKIQWAHALSA